MEISERCLRIPVGKLSVYFHRDPFYWFRGLCIHGVTLDGRITRFLVIVAGPLFPVCIGLSFLFLGLVSGSGWTIFLSSLLTSVALLSAINDFRPAKVVGVDDAGDYLLNDGCQLSRLIDRKWQQLRRELVAAELTDDPASIGAVYEKMLRYPKGRATELRLAIQYYTDASQFRKVTELWREFQPPVVTPELLLHVSYSQSVIGEYEEADKHLIEALELAPHHTIALNNLGYSHLQTGRLEDALSCLEKAADISPGFGTAWCNKALVLGLLRRKEEAVAAFESAKKYNGQAGYILLHEGILAWRDENYDEAAELFTKAKQLQPDVLGLDEWREMIFARLHGHQEPDVSNRRLTYHLWG